VDGNTLRQWISTGFADDDKFIIWQRYGYLECVIRNLPQLKGRKKFICVIIVDATFRALEPEEAQDSSSFVPSVSE
jgi:hypothetical protein